MKIKKSRFQSKLEKTKKQVLAAVSLGNAKIMNFRHSWFGLRYLESFPLDSNYRL